MVSAITACNGLCRDRLSFSCHGTPSDGVRVHYLPFQNIYFGYADELPSWTQSAPAKLIWHTLNTFNPRIQVSLATVLANKNPDLLHTNNVSGLSTAIWSSANKIGVPIVHTIRDYYLLCHRAQMFRKGSNCDGLCWHCKPFMSPRVRATRHVNAVVGISQFILDRHLEYGAFPDAKQRIIPNPYKIDVNDEETSNKNYSSDHLRIGFLGRLSPAKGIEALLNAVQNLPFTKWTLDVGGAGPEAYVERLEREYECERVTFCGYVSTGNFLSSIDLLVVPSLWHEPLGRVVIEAFFYGVPVAGAIRGGIPELIDEGVTGWLFDPSQLESLRNILTHCYHDLDNVRRMEPVVREASTKFRTAIIVDKYLRLFEDVIDSPLSSA